MDIKAAEILKEVLIGLLRRIQDALEHSIYEDAEIITMHTHIKALKRLIETAEWL